MKYLLIIITILFICTTCKSRTAWVTNFIYTSEHIATFTKPNTIYIKGFKPIVIPSFVFYNQTKSVNVEIEQSNNVFTIVKVWKDELIYEAIITLEKQ